MKNPKENFLKDSKTVEVDIRFTSDDFGETMSFSFEDCMLVIDWDRLDVLMREARASYVCQNKDDITV